MNKYLRIIGVVILCIILWKVDLSKLFANFRKIYLPFLLLSILLNIPMTLIKSVRWNMLLRSQSIIYTYKDSFLVYLSSIYAGVITPGRLGEFIKALYLKYDKNISVSRGMSSVILDRLFDMYVLVILGTLGIWKFHIFGNSSNISFIVIALLLMIPALLIKKELTENILKKLYRFTVLKKTHENIKEKFKYFYTGMSQMMTPKLFLSFLLTLSSYLIFFIQCYLISKAMHISIDFITITLFMAISNLISFIPISISGLGTRDAVLIYLFSIIGLEPELAVSFAFLIFITFYVSIGVMGAIALWIKPLDISNPEAFANSK